MMGNKLLVVDSDPNIHHWAETNLPTQGFEVTCYQDGLSALDMLSSVDPDVVMADYNLVGMNIYRFCDKLKQKSISKSRPTFILVGPEDQTDSVQLEGLGGVELIKKPLNLESVLEKIGRPEGTVEAVKEENEDDRTTLVIDPSRNSAEFSSTEAPETHQELPSGDLVEKKSEEPGEDLKLEELLGWSLASDREGQPASTGGSELRSQSIPGDDDRTVFVEEEAMSHATNDPHVDDSPSLTEHATQSTVSGSLEDSADEPTLVMSLAEAMHGPEKIEEVESDATQVAPASTPPSFSESTPSPSSQADVEATVSTMAREIIEKVAWEVVPAIAETLIKEELEKINSETPK